MSKQTSLFLGTALFCAALGFTVAPVSAQPGPTLAHFNGLATQDRDWQKMLNIEREPTGDRADIGRDVPNGIQRSESAV